MRLTAAGHGVSNRLHSVGALRLAAKVLGLVVLEFYAVAALYGPETANLDRIYFALGGRP